MYGMTPHALRPVHGLPHHTRHHAGTRPLVLTAAARKPPAAASNQADEDGTAALGGSKSAKAPRAARTKKAVSGKEAAVNVGDGTASAAGKAAGAPAARKRAPRKKSTDEDSSSSAAKPSRRKLKGTPREGTEAGEGEVSPAAAAPAAGKRASTRGGSSPSQKSAPATSKGGNAVAAASTAASTAAAAAARFTYQGIRLVDHPAYGRTACTSRAFPAGSLMIQEEPLMFVPAQPDPFTSRHVTSIQQAAQAQGVTIPFSLILKLLVFTTASKEVQDEFLAFEMAPDPAPFLGGSTHAGSMPNKAVQKIMEAVEVCASHFAGFTKERLTQVLMAFEVNAHMVKGGMAVYKWGSKLGHTCGKFNTVYEELEGKFCQISQCTISPGTVLTTSYIGEFYRIMSTRCRQRYLRQHFLFTCCCGMCTKEPDFYRGLPCPSCLSNTPGAQDARGMLSTEYALGRLPLPGVVVWDPAKVASGKPWQCTSCRSELAALPQQLQQAEDQVEQEVLDLLALSERYSLHSVLGTSGRGERLHLKAAHALGPEHWATHVAALLSAEVAAYALGEQVMGHERPTCTMTAHLAAIEFYIGDTGRWLGSLPLLHDHSSTVDSHPSALITPDSSPVTAATGASAAVAEVAGEEMNGPAPSVGSGSSADGGGSREARGERTDAISGYLLVIAEQLMVLVEAAQSPTVQTGRYGSDDLRQALISQPRVYRTWPRPAHQLQAVDKIKSWLVTRSRSSV